jgi:hypothetical protein
MIDIKLIADALKKSAGQHHLAANHCTCYQGNMTRYQSDRSDLVSKNEAEFHERVLRSFLVTECVRTSEEIVQTT